MNIYVLKNEIRTKLKKFDINKISRRERIVNFKLKTD